jgi:outer membrane receptor protein involved in Fe transport
MLKFLTSFILIFFFSFSTILLPQGRGNIKGKVTDEKGAVIPFATVLVVGTQQGAAGDAVGEYIIKNLAAGTYTLKASVTGYRTATVEVKLSEGETLIQNFQLTSDALRMDEVVVTGAVRPKSKLGATVAISTITPKEIQMASPRSTTEILRYIPGFTRVESSGGEVNQNISMRGILGVEYVMFMEDGMPVFPTMHTFFMNADNLFRPDENISKVEIVRGGNSALFGSNTPGAIINFINKTGDPQFRGVMKSGVGSEGLARYDFNFSGPLSENFRFNIGGFYRYDRGARYPGFPGIRGGQIKVNVTRLLDNGYVRLSGKYIDDRNQFILPLPFKNPSDPTYVSGFSEYGSMNTNEGNHIVVPTKVGELELPLDNGLRTQASWLTAEVGFNFNGDWSIQNIAQIMNNDQEWNAILPFDIISADVWAKSQIAANNTYKLFYTNYFDDKGAKLPFDNSNGLVAPGGNWTVKKPISAFQDQFQIKKTFGQNSVFFGLYFANYSQTNKWYFTDILMDVRDNPRLLDLVAYDGAKATQITKNGFRNYLSYYVSGTGQTTVLSGVIGAEVQLMENLRADLGIRYEWNDFVQTSENTSSFDLDGNPATKYDNETWGNGSFRQFNRSIRDWAGSIGLNYTVNPQLSVYAQAGRGYKMPALDEFLNAQAQAQVNLFDSRNVTNYETGVKYASPTLGFSFDVFYTLLKNIIGQGAVTDPVTGRTIWIVQTSPENNSYGAEFEVSANLFDALKLFANGTLLKAELGSGAGADIGSWLNGVPSFIGNLTATYSFDNITLLADLHYVADRYSDVKAGNKLPAYQYMNLGISYNVPGQGITINADVLNAFQSIGLEEGNPRLALVGGRTSDLFLARPILPRRFTLGVRYEF